MFYVFACVYLLCMGETSIKSNGFIWPWWLVNAFVLYSSHKTYTVVPYFFSFFCSSEHVHHKSQDAFCINLCSVNVLRQYMECSVFMMRWMYYQTVLVIPACRHFAHVIFLKRAIFLIWCIPLIFCDNSTWPLLPDVVIVTFLWN